MKYIFYTVIILSGFFALVAISRRNPIYALLNLLGLSLSIAAIFVLYNAYFLALIQVILYSGAVLVLFLFVISMMNLREWELVFGAFKSWRILSILPTGLLFAIAVTYSTSVYPKIKTATIEQGAFSVYNIGLSLYKKYAVQFEILSVLLLSVVVGIIFAGVLRRR